jgi:hypothetical protein
MYMRDDCTEGYATPSGADMHISGLKRYIRRYPIQVCLSASPRERMIVMCAFNSSPVDLIYVENVGSAKSSHTAL